MKATILFTALLLFELSGFAQCSYYIKVATGNNGTHTLAIRNDGTLWAWGNNNNGQLGDGTNIQRNNPVQIGSGTNWVHIAAGSQHSLGITSDGKLWSWGLNSSGQLGDGSFVSSNTPSQVGNKTNWVQIAGGGFHSIARTVDGKIWTWGNNGKGQLGDGSLTNRKTPIQVGNSNDWVSISAGEYHTMALENTGKLWAWGDNTAGQLGDGSYIQKSTPKVVSGPTNWVAFEAGGAHSVGKTAEGKIWAWGDNSFGQLGDGTAVTKNVPVQIGTATNWSNITAGQYHSACVSKDGKLYAWGYNLYGQLGDGTNIQRNSPVQIASAQIWKNIIIGGYHSLAMTTDGKVWTWGYNTFGQLGDGSTSNKNLPNSITSGPLTYFATQPQSMSTCEGTKVVFKSKAFGTGTITYQWKKNGVNIASTADSIVLNNITLADSGMYHVVATGTCNSVASDTANLDVLRKINIINHPISQSINSNSNVGFSVAATGGIIGYQWRKNGAAIANANNPILILNNVDFVDTGNYDVVIYGACDTVISGSANLNVLNNSCAYYLKIVSGPNSAHSLGIKNDGTLWAWGINTSGQLGEPTVAQTNIPVQVGYATNWVAVSAGESHSIGITADGKLWGWGWNGYGQLGNGTTTNINIPTQIGVATNWTKIAAGAYHTLGITADGKLWAWGQNAVGQLGDGTTTQRLTPKQIGNNTNWVVITAGENHSLGRTSDGKLWAWGFNGVGQLGDGTTNQRNSPVQVGNNTNWTSIAAGTYHSLGRTSDGKLWAWGYNFYGQLGDGTTTQRKNPTQVGTATNWVSVSGGYRHSIGMTNDGKLWAWGYNFYGQLGDASNVQRNSPVLVNTTATWTSHAAGQNHTLAISNDGKLKAWGRNSEGQLGDSTNINKNSPVLIAAGTPTTIIDQPLDMTICEGANHMFTVGVTGPGTLNYQWKLNGVNVGTNSDTLILSNITPSDSGYYKVVVTGSCSSLTSDSALLTVKLLPTILKEPASQMANEGSNITISVDAIGAGLSYQWRHNGVDIPGQTNGTLNLNNLTKADSGLYSVVVSGECDVVYSNSANVSIIDAICSGYSKVASGSNANHSVVTKNDGTLWAWGDNGSGQLGDGTTNQKNNAVQIGTINNWSNISTGQLYTAGVTADGKIYTWGDNGFGQLGDGTFTDKHVPTQVAMNKNWSKVAVGLYHTVAIATDGTLWSWGRNNHGQLGDGSTNDQNTPIQIGTATNWDKIACGNNHTLAITKDGKLWAWGRNTSGQLGDATVNNRNNPTQIGTATNWVQIAGGGSHSVALNAEGKIFAWGSNINGQIGDGSTLQKNVPTQVGTSTNWKSIAAGMNHTMAVMLDGKLYAWGHNGKGQLGDGTTNQRTSPVQVAAGISFISVSTGNEFSAAISNDGKTWAWGENNKGQLGDGTTNQRNIPVSITNAPFIGFNLQPDHKYVCLGQNPVFKTTISGNGALTYKWFKNDTLIAGANKDSLMINNVNETDTGTYYVTVKGTCNTITSVKGSLHLDPVTAIIQQPVTTYSCLGGNRSFNVKGNGTGTISYQWFKNGVNTGVTADSININNIAISDTGLYFAKVTGTCGTVYSDTVLLGLSSVLSITKQPESSNLCTGSHIGLAAGVSGNGPRTYQWYKNNQPIGTNQDTFIIYGLMPTDTGYYKVRITGMCNTVMSDSVNVSMKNKITLTQQPSPQVACPGSKVELSVVSSDPNFTNYQWYKNGVKFGPNSSILTLNSVSDTDAAKYMVLVSGFCNSIYSDSVLVGLSSQISLKTAPIGKEVCAGENVELGVEVVGTNNVTYNWMKNNIALGITTSKLSLQNIKEEAAGVYRVEVKSACNTVISDSAVLKVNNCSSSIQNNPEVKTFGVYPNPFRSKLHITYEAKENQIAQAMIYDVAGRIVFHSELPTTAGKNEQIIFPSNLLNGAYMLFVEVDGQKLSFKLLREE